MKDLNLDKLEPILRSTYEAGMGCQKVHDHFQRTYDEVGKKRPDIELPSFDKWFLDLKIIMGILMSD